MASIILYFTNKKRANFSVSALIIAKKVKFITTILVKGLNVGEYL